MSMKPYTDDELIINFWSKVDKLPGDDICWLWTASKDKDGYGLFNVHRKRIRAHRWIYTQEVGPIPKGWVIDHIICDNPSCVRPNHLKAVTHKENVLRSKTGLSAVNARKTHCKNGHEFTPENTGPRADAKNGRRCKQCDREGSRRRKANKKDFPKEVPFA